MESNLEGNDYLGRNHFRRPMKHVFPFLLLLLVASCNSDTQSNDETEAQPPSDQNTVNDNPENEMEEEYIPIDMNFRQLDEIPDELDYAGYIFDCHEWTDKNGKNYFLRTLEEPVQAEMAEDLEPDGLFFFDQYLHAYHYVQAEENAALELKRELIDFVKECDFDMTVKHLEAIELNDVDKDNWGEITFGYWLACRSDVSPSDFKVITFENGDKYALRGTSVAIGYGGDYEVGKEYDNAPEGFVEVAENYWEQNKVEFEVNN